MRIERDGVAEGRLRARRIPGAQGGHTVPDPGQGHRLEAVDVPLDAQTADLAHRPLRRFGVALALRLLVGRPQRVEARSGGGRLSRPDVDHLVARRREEEEGKEGRGENGHRPPALVACT